MKCATCSGPIVLRTDPKNRDYEIVSGATRQTLDYGADDAQVIDLPDEKQQRRMYDDPLYKLEHKEKDKTAGKEGDEHLRKLIIAKQSNEDDYRASRLVRSQFRKRKAEEVAEEKANREKGIYVPLVAEHPDDIRLAARTVFRGGSSSNKESLKKPHVAMAKKKSSIFTSDKKK